MKKIHKNVISLMMVMLLGFTGIISVHAAPGDEDEAPAASIHLTKTLVSPDPDVAALPVDMEFEFEISTGVFKPHGSDDIDANVTAPVITNPTLVFTNDDIGTVANGAKVTHKQTDDLLQVFRDQLDTLEPGVYEYVITEKQDTVTGLDNSVERVEYDAVSYTLRVYISRGADGEPVIDGGTVEGPDGKVEPGPGTEVPGAPGAQEIAEANGFNFRNVYTKDAGSITPPDPEVENAGFIIDKVVTGDLANTDDEFTYLILLTENAVTQGKTYTLNVAGVDHTVTPGTALEFVLKGGERAWLLDVPVGIEVLVQETDYGYYVPSIFTVEDGSTTINDVMDTDYVAGTDGTVVLGENSNLAAYMNTWNKTTPTGIFIDNLPYIALVALAGLGLFLSVVIKRKTAHKYQ